MITILLLSLAGAVVAAVVGTVWYSNATPMGKIHMRYLGFDKLTPEEKKAKMQEAKPMMPMMYAGQLGLSFLTAFAVSYIIITGGRNGMPFSMSLTFVAMNWLCFMVPIVGSALLWSNCDRSIVWKKFFSDIGANLVTLIVMALVAKLFV